MKLIKIIKKLINKILRKKIYYDELRQMAYIQKYLEHRQRENRTYREELEKQFNETRK